MISPVAPRRPGGRAHRCAAVALFAAVAAFGSACKDAGPEPAPTRLTRAMVDSKIEALRQFYSDPVLRGIANYRPEDIIDRRPLARVGRSSLVSSQAAVAITIPAAIRGRTYIFHPSVAMWVATTRVGAPVDGIRFVVPARDAQGTWTSTEIGLVDVRDVGTSADRALEVTVRDPRGVLATFVTRRPAGSGSTQNVSNSAEGSLSHGGRTVDFSTVLVSDQGPPQGRMSQRYDWAMRSAGVSGVHAWASSTGIAIGDSTSVGATLDRAAVRFVTRTVAGTSGGPPTSTDVVLLNERPYATRAEVDLGVFDYVAPDGSPLSADERSALARMPLLMWGYGEWPLVVRSTVASWVGDVLLNEFPTGHSSSAASTRTSADPSPR